jgi:agmatinase
MPAVMAPSPGGIYYRQLAPLLRQVARRNRVVGLDIVEVAPSYDFGNALTCVMAGRLIMNVVAARAN